MSEDPDLLLNILEDSNPWWQDGRVPSSLSARFRRRDFYVFKGHLMEGEKVVVLAGPRQVGKTTLFYQFTESLLEDRVNPSHVLFLSMDHPGLRTSSSDPINTVLHLYEDRVLHTSFRNLKEPCIVLLDEVTQVSSWHRDVKGWFDRKLPLRFAVSSSSLPIVRGGASESLVGRATVQLLLPMKFSDVLALRSGRDSHVHPSIESRKELAHAVQSHAPGRLVKWLREMQPRGSASKIPLREALEWYLLTNGYPELAGISDLRIAARRLHDYVDLTMTHDLYGYYSIRSSTRVLEELLERLAFQSGQLFSVAGVAREIGLDMRVLSKYIALLESNLLINVSPFYSKSVSARQRKQRKVYVSNPGLLNYLRGRLDRAILKEPLELGRVAESVVREHLGRLVYNLQPGIPLPIYYWRDRRGHEVDMVTEIAGKALPIEVKYRSDPRRDLSGLESFLSEHDSPFGIVVTRDLLEEDGGLVFIPLDTFLLMA